MILTSAPKVREWLVRIVSARFRRCFDQFPDEGHGDRRSPLKCNVMCATATPPSKEMASYLPHASEERSFRKGRGKRLTSHHTSASFCKPLLNLTDRSTFEFSDDVGWSSSQVSSTRPWIAILYILEPRRRSRRRPGKREQRRTSLDCFLSFSSFAFAVNRRKDPFVCSGYMLTFIHTEDDLFRQRGASNVTRKPAPRETGQR